MTVGMLNIAVGLTVAFCTAIVFYAIFLNFYRGQKAGTVKKEKRSVVATGSMFAYYVCYYLIIRFSIGRLVPDAAEWQYVLCGVGLLLIIGGTFVNVEGRLRLGGNWANHIKIYDQHTFVHEGSFRYVRHPLYSSLIVMLIGGAMVYSNWLAALSVFMIFTPAMVYRAKQEETLLVREFPEYRAYQAQVGMLFPMFWKGGYRHVGVSPSHDHNE